MALEQKLSLRMAQKLVMTPSLQQAIKLLQMTRMELEGVLTQELVENPVLEEGTEIVEDEREQAKEKETTPEEAATDEKVDDPLDRIDLEEYFGDYMDGPSYASIREDREGAPLENTLSREPDLYDHLLFQLHMADTTPLTRRIAELIIGNLDSDGFLVATLEEIAVLVAEDLGLMMADEEAAGVGVPTPEEALSLIGSNGFSPSPDGGEDEVAAWLPEEEFLFSQVAEVGEEESFQEDGAEEAGRDGAEADDEATEAPGLEIDPALMRELEDALALVRGFDPPGVARRNLRESLLAQLEATGVEKGSLAWRMLDEQWDLFLRRQFAQIARLFEVDLAELEPVVECIRGLETRPGRQFASERTHYIEPDVNVRKIGDEYVVQLNDDGLPRLRVSRAYRQMFQKMRREGRENEAQQYIKDKMRSAVWLIKSLDQRQRTIYKVATSIIKQQRGFFDHGIEHLRPMVLRDVAEDIEMHESTVSRVVSNKYIHTPRGLFPLKFFFHSGIDRDRGENISSLTVKRKLEQIIQSEDPKHPHSDSALMKILKREGIQIARRTVAKYRDELEIPSSTERKQIF